MRLPARLYAAFPAWLAAATVVCLPATAIGQTTTVNDISVSGEGFTVSVPAVESTDSSLDEASLRALFSGDLAGTADELAALDAASIRIPEIRIEYPVPATAGEDPGSARLVYRDLELKDVVDGVAASASFGSAEVTVDEGATITFEPMTMRQLDLGGILGFYGFGSTLGGEDLRTVYADFVFGGMHIVSPEMSCDFGETRIAEIQARPVKGSLQDVMAATQRLDAAETAGTPPASEDIAVILDFYLDYLTAFRSTPFEFDGFACSGKDDTGKPLAIRSGSIGIGGFEPGIYPQIAVNDFRIEVQDDGWMNFANFTLKAMDFTSVIATLKQAETLDEAWFGANWRKLVPLFAGLSMRGFAMDIPDEERPGERVQASVGGFDVTLGNYVNGMPADIALSASDIEVALPEDAGPELAALGLETLRLGYDLQLHWDQPSETIVVDRLLVEGGGMGTVTVSGTLGNATAELFSDDLEAATAAGLGLSLRDVEITIVDDGLAAAAIVLAASEEGQDPAAFRAVLSGLAEAMPLALLGASEDSLAAGRALRGFIDGAPNLTVKITSIDPAGISLTDLEALEKDPAALAGKLSIAAESSGEPRPLPAPPPASASPAEPEPEATPAEPAPAEPAPQAAPAEPAPADSGAAAEQPANRLNRR